MSLVSGGSSFEIHVALNENQRNCLVPHIVEKPLESKVVISNQTAVGDITHNEAAKNAFIETMTIFANSKEFEALTYNLSNSFNISVFHQINLKMNID